MREYLVADILNVSTRQKDNGERVADIPNVAQKDNGERVADVPNVALKDNERESSRHTECSTEG